MGKYTNMSFNEVKALAEKGDAEAQDSLGSRFINGEGTARSESEAVKWFRKSAEQGCPDGECHLGICYEAGLGVKQDYYEAKKWYLKAANKGKDVAQANLASIICNGFVGRPDYDEAALWSKRAADQGFQPAIDNLQVLRNAGLLNERLINNDHFVPEKWNEKTPEKTSKNKDKITFKKRSDLISEGDDYPMTIKVNNEWTFKCPSDCIINYECEFDGGLNMGVDVTGSIKPAVIKGIKYQDKFRFNFALEEHFDFFGKGYSIEDCKYDNDILSDSNIYHKVIVDEDDFYVDIIKKTIIFFTDEIRIRVRGSNIKAFNFSSCTSQTDIADRYCKEEVLRKVEEIAKSIKLIKASKKTASKKTSTKDNNPDFIISNGVLKKYIGKSKDIVVPEGVKSIDDNICSGRQDIRSLTIPEGVKAIGRRAFENCYNLEKVTLPDSLKEIGGYAFVDCHKLKTINLPGKLEVIGDSAFSECYVLENVEIPSKIKEIEAFAFKNCDAFTKVTLPEGVKKIGFSAFAYCDNLEYLYVPESVMEIEDDFMDKSAFEGSNKLTVHCPAGSYAEKYCKKHGIKVKNENKKTTAASGKSAKSNTFETIDTAIVDNTWVVDIPNGYKYCTDRKIIGNHRNIIIMEDKADNDFEDPFCASVSFTSMFTDSQGNSAPMTAKVTAGMIGGGEEIIKNEDDIYVSYGYQPNRSYKEGQERLDVYRMYVGCGKGVSSIQVFFNNSKLSRKDQNRLVDSVARTIRLKSEEKKQPGAKVKKTAKRDEAVRNVKFAVADVIEKNIKLKNGDVSKKYVARFVPVSEFLEDGAVYNVYSNYVLSYEVDNKKEISDALNKYLDIFNDEEKYDIKYGCLKNTTPLHALRSFAWTSAETFNKRDRDHLDPNITTDMLLDLADFIYDRDFANYKVIKSDSLRFGYPIIPKQEINCWYPLEYSDFDFRYTFKKGYFNLAHYDGIYYPLWSVIRMLKEMITFMDVFFEACKDDRIDENVAYASRTILEGWCYYASAIKSPFALIASDDLKTDKTPEEIIKETDVESELKKIETQDGITTYDNIIFNIDRDIIGNEFVIPEGITRIFEEGIIRIIGAYPVKNKMMRMIYPSTFTGTVYYLSNTKELIINSNVDVLDVKMASRDAYKDGSDLEKLEINGNVRRIERQNFWSKKLKQIKLSDTIESIGFNLYSKELTSVRLPDNLKELEKGVFQFCNLKTVTIPENLEVIGENAFGFDVSGIRFEAYKDSVGYETIKKYLASKNARNNITLLDPIWMEKALSFSSKISAEYSSSLQADDIKERIMDIINSTLANNENYTKGRKKIISNIYTDQLDIVKKTVEECETIEELKSKLPSLLAEDIPKVKREKEIKKTKNLITEKKLQISRLEKEISEKEEKIKNYEKEIDENQQMLSSKESSLGYDLGNKKFQLTTNLNGQKAVIFKLEEKIKEIEILIENTSKELEDAGFFKFSLKKELNTKIDSLNSEIAKIRENLKSESTKLDEITKEYSELVEKPSAELESLKSKVSNLIFTKRQISASIDSAKKSIEDYRGEILRLEERLNKAE